MSKVLTAFYAYYPLNLLSAYNDFKSDLPESYYIIIKFLLALVKTSQISVSKEPISSISLARF